MDPHLLDPHPLDSVVWSALTGPHAHLAEGANGARRYPDEMSPFAALDPVLFNQAQFNQAQFNQAQFNQAQFNQAQFNQAQGLDAGWADLATLAGPGGAVTVTGRADVVTRLPADWTIGLQLPGVQMVATEALAGEPDPEAVLLQKHDVPEMLDLVRRTEPGPFGTRTIEMGRYLGIRRDGQLVAMAGERLRPPRFTEISAVCTAPEARGQGLASRLVLAVAHGIRERGDIPFLHAAAANASAIRLYEHLGFALRRRPDFFFLAHG